MNPRHDPEAPRGEGGLFEEQHESLRRLARHLVGKFDVEDVVQDTWLAALESGGTPALVRPTWLRAVLRKKALLAHRNRGRQVAREKAVAQPEASPPGPDHAELEIARRHLLASLNALGEPERTLLRLHYFEGLSIPALSERLLRPRDTIKGQLKRALAELRAEFKRRSGSRDAQSALLLIGLCRRPEQVTILASRAPTLLALGSALGGLALLLWSGSRPGRSEATRPVSDSDVASARSAHSDDGRGGDAMANDRDGSRILLAAGNSEKVAETTSVVAAAVAEERLWRVRTLAPDGQPLADATVFVNGPEQSAATDREGWAQLSIDANQRNSLELELLAGRWTFYAEHADYLRSHLVHVDPSATTSNELGIRFEHPRTIVRGRVRTSDGQGLGGGRIALSDQDRSYIPSEDGVVLTTAEETATTQADGSFALPGRIAAGNYLRIEREGIAPFSSDVTEIALGEHGLELEVVAGVNLSGTVCHENGSGVSGARVGFSTFGGAFYHEVSCDEEGRYSTHTLPVGPLTLWAIDPERPAYYASTRLEIRFGEAFQWSPDLREHRAFRIRIVDEDSKPLPGILCQLGLDDWFDSRHTDANGWTPPFTSYPDAPTSIFLHDSEHPITMPLLFLDDRILDGQDLELVLRKDALVFAPLQGTIVDAAGHPPADGFALFLTIATAPMGMPYFEIDAATGSFRAEPQPPGEYALVVTLPKHGVHVFPPFRLTPGVPLNLQAISLPVAGQLVLELGGGTSADTLVVLEYQYQLGARRNHFFAGAHQPQAGRLELDLLPGEYRARAWRGQRELGSTLVMIQSTETTSARLAIDG